MQDTSLTLAPEEPTPADVRGREYSPVGQPGLPICNLQFAICNLQFISRILQFSVLVALCSFLFFYRLADRDLWSSHEGRAAQDAQSIVSEGRWGVPHLFDQQYLELQKPPLFYWIVASIAAIRSAPVDAWDVRLPAAAAGLLTVLGIYVFAACRGRPSAGFLAAGILATAQHYTALARIGRIDMPLTFAASVALCFFYLGWCRQKECARRDAWFFFAIAYTAVAVGLLLKGPIGFFLPATVVGAFLLMEGELPLPWQSARCWRLARSIGLWWGLPLLLGLACPWYVWADHQTGGALFRTFLWYHNVERALGAGGLRAHPWWFYGPRFAFDFLPWTPLLALGGWWVFRCRSWRDDPEARFGVAWLVGMLLVLSCAGFKRADYLVPAYPGAALFLGSVGERWLSAARHKWRLTAGYGIVLAGCAAAWFVYLNTVVAQEDERREDRSFAAEIRRLAPPPQTIIFFRLEAHALAFHVGRPLYTVMEWENLDAWAGKPQTLYVVMTPEIAADWPAHMSAGRLEEVLRNSDLNARDHERPLILFRTRPANVPSRH